MRRSLNLGLAEGKAFCVPVEVCKKHIVALGSSGSGKTVFCKTIIEEAALQGIPSILVDPQGDLASLLFLEEKTDEKIKERWRSIRVTVFTPTSSKGIPLCINPLQLPKIKLEKEDQVSILNQTATALCQLLGFDLGKDEGKAAQALFFIVFDFCYRKSIMLETFDGLASFLLKMPQELKAPIAAFVSSKAELDRIVKKVRFLTVGEKDLLFQFGVPLDIDVLLGKGSLKTQVSVIYLNTLESQQDKEFFLSMLSTKLYAWMLAHPSKSLQALYYIDEISSFLPAGALKPACKPILTLLYKQARKYGIGCIMSTQNPGDVDYKAFAQFSTWAIGRLTTRQDREKIKDAVHSFSKEAGSKSIQQLPRLRPGHFLVFCPDVAKKALLFSVRRLYTKHMTLTDKEVKDAISPHLRKEYDSYLLRRPDQTDAPVVQESQPAAKDVSRESKEPLFLKCRLSLENARLLAKDVCKSRLFRKKETIHDLHLRYEPFFLLKVRQGKRRWFWRTFQTADLSLLIDTREYMMLQKNEMTRGFHDLFGLSPDAVHALKYIAAAYSMRAADLSVRLHIDEARQQTVITELRRKKLITVVRKKEDQVLMINADLSLPSSLSSLAQERYETEEQPRAPISKVTVDNAFIENCAQALDAWFGNVQIISYMVLYCPWYEAKLLNAAGRCRTLSINAYTGHVAKEVPF